MHIISLEFSSGTNLSVLFTTTQSDNMAFEGAASVLSLNDLLKVAGDKFKKEFDSEANVKVSAPGRVNLIGEHTDYNEGFVFPMVI